MTAPVPDLDQARRFLALLDEEAPAFCFQTATDAEPKPLPDHLARVINLPPDNLKALAIRNGNGAAVWVMINAGDGKGRRAENVTRVRAVFADLDGAPLQPVMACELEPHVRGREPRRASSTPIGSWTACRSISSRACSAGSPRCSAATTSPTCAG